MFKEDPRAVPMNASSTVKRSESGSGRSVVVYTHSGDPPIEDAELVKAVQGGDTIAFRRLYERHAEELARLVFRILGSNAEVDDVVQESFVIAFERIAKIEQPQQFRRWLTTIGVRRCWRRLRRQRFRHAVRGLLAHTAPAASDPDALGPADELWDVLRQLPPDLRIPWIMARVERRRLDDVADACEVSLATVKRRIALAQERIDRRLARE
ncbi:MAG: RNA polymerase sigma factor [Myxococcales bacterium FL481]|nr:MAG: RNA polymerase sigma factor [Myxococcales bacterium FL481]